MLTKHGVWAIDPVDVANGWAAMKKSLFYSFMKKDYDQLIDQIVSILVQHLAIKSMVLDQ